MAKLIPMPPLAMFSQHWSGMKIKEDYAGELVSVAIPAGTENDFSRQFKKAYGVKPPLPNEMQEFTTGRAFWTSPDQYMLHLPGDNIHADLDVAQKFSDGVYTTLQSDAWASLNVQGDRIYDVIERFIPLDLRNAPTGFAARTSAHHIAVICLKFSETELQLLTPRSSAQSFLDALVHTADNVLD